MPQKTTVNKPIKVNTESNETILKADESPFLKNIQIASAKNQTRDGAEGGNFGVGTPVNANVLLEANIPLPAGENICVGAGGFKETNEVYCCYWNSNKDHGVYRINGRDLSVETVVIDPELNFSLDPKHAIPAHRMVLKVVYDGDNEQNKTIKEKIYQITDGLNWQRWINVEASIATNGFDPVNPYWALQPPHYDRAELIDLAVRPPMDAPRITPLAPTPQDLGKANHILDQSIQLAFNYLYTDGRPTPLSPHSSPYAGVRSSFDISASASPRTLAVGLDAGSPLVEKIQLFHRTCAGDWKLYDTINKFSSCGVNDPEVIGKEYWKRTEPFAGYDYDPKTNTLTYLYSGDRESSIDVAGEGLRVQTDLPIKSTAITAAGDAILLANNLYEYPNLDCDVLNQIVVDVKEPKEKECVVKTVTLKLYAILSRDDARNQVVYKKTEEATERFFGGLEYVSAIESGDRQARVALFDREVDEFGLTLKEKDGFLCYLAGTPYYAIGKQYRVDQSGNKTLVGVLDRSKKDDTDLINNTIHGGAGYFIQEFEFNVPAGRYIARLAGHQASEDDNLYARTSTFVAGIAGQDQLSGGGIAHRDLLTRSKEMEIDASAGDVDTWTQAQTAFYIFVPQFYYANGNFFDLGIANRRYRFIDGYVQEDDKDKIPVELLSYRMNKGDNSKKKAGGMTDHNGFFWGYTARDDARKSEVVFSGKFNCKQSNDFLTTKIRDNDRGYFGGQNISVKENNNNTFGDCNRVVVRGRITDCQTGAGLSGVGVTLTNGGTYYSNAEGDVELIAHNGTEAVRKDRIYINGGGDATFVNCGCVPVATIQYNDSLIPCTSCTVREYPVRIDTKLKVSQIRGGKGLKGGGRYGIYAFVGDLAGRTTYAGLVKYQDIPTFMEKGTFQPSELVWSLKGKLGLPEHAAWLVFGRTQNLNFKYMQWVGDKIEFLDRNGDTTSTGNGAVRAKITIQSLLDFNTEQNFATTVGYQFTAGDRIRICDDGRGNLFPPTEAGFMEYTVLGTNFNQTIEGQLPAGEGEEVVEDGKSLIINYDSRLKALSEKCGFWIELLTPRGDADVESIFEIAGSIPVVNGEPLITSGDLNTFDTWYQNRSFKIEGCSGKVFNHPFESDSVTDYWGKGCPTGGKIRVRDEKAQPRWYPDDVIKSDDFVNEGRVNGLGTYRGKNRKNFKGNEWGGIVAMHAERGMVAFICQRDWFLTDYERNYARVTREGLIQASLDTNLEEPHQKTGNNYGCDFEDTASIDFYDGMALWADRANSSVILMDYQQAVDISSIMNKSYFLNKFRYMDRFNALLPEEDRLRNLMVVTALVDPSSRNYQITFRPRRNLSALEKDFINNEREVRYDMQETFCFNLDQKEWTQWISPCPEFYARLSGSISGKELISFAAGKPYLHNSETGRYNEFYGQPVDQVVEIVINESRSQDKLFQGLRVEAGGVGYFVDSITTNKPNTFSYMTMAHFAKRENVYKGSIKGDMNTYPSPEHPRVSMLVDGAAITGQWMRCRLVRDPARQTDYNELDNILTQYFERAKI